MLRLVIRPQQQHLLGVLLMPEDARSFQSQVDYPCWSLFTPASVTRVPSRRNVWSFVSLFRCSKPASGNTVILIHREHEVSVLGHFQQGSIRVKCGDKVKRGQVLGLCGNSGNSSEPHLHFHVQNTPVLHDGTGLRCVFEKITVTGNGKSESRTSYSPVKGDIVRQE